MKARGCGIVFMRMRSPSSAPPVFRREGSTESTATVRTLGALEEAQHQLVAERGLARAAGAGDPDDDRSARRRQRVGGGADGAAHRRLREPGLFARADRRREQPPVGGRERGHAAVGGGPGRRVVGPLEHVVDHALEAEPTAVVRAEDLVDAVRLERRDLLGDDDPAAATEDPDVRGAHLAEQVLHVPEELVVAALIRRDRDGLRVLFDGGLDDLEDRPVVAEMDDLGARVLEQAADHVDRGVVAVEQRRGRHESNRVLRAVAGGGHGNP